MRKLAIEDTLPRSQRMLAKILQVLKEGKILYISTRTRTTKVSQKDVEKFDAIGKPLFKANKDNLYMASGKSYVIIDYCKFTVEG